MFWNYKPAVRRAANLGPRCCRDKTRERNSPPERYLLMSGGYPGCGDYQLMKHAQTFSCLVHAERGTQAVRLNTVETHLCNAIRRQALLIRVCLRADSQSSVPSKNIILFSTPYMDVIQPYSPLSTGLRRPECQNHHLLPTIVGVNSNVPWVVTGAIYWKTNSNRLVSTHPHDLWLLVKNRHKCSWKRSLKMSGAEPPLPQMNHSRFWVNINRNTFGQGCPKYVCSL
jgi:hypothetical protein